MRRFNLRVPKLVLLLVLLLALSTFCKAVFAAAPSEQVKTNKEIDKLRKFYSQHNLDFFGDLISDQNDMLIDEKKHAKLELLADDARTRALEQLEKLYKTATPPMQAELLIRKATLFSDRARTAIYFQNNPFKASKLKAPRFYLEQSIKTFIDVERRFGNHPKMDIILFSVGYNYGELRDVDNAFKYYDRMVQKYGDSPLVGDARLAMAEILFDKRRFADALHHLREIVKSEHPRLKNFALYKMAWTYYNMADLDSAMASLEKVIDGVNSATNVQRAKLELRKEALHDLVGFYAELPNSKAPGEAASYFERVGRTPSAILNDLNAARAKRLASYKERKVAIPDEDSDAFHLSEPQELLFRLTNVYKDQGKHENAMIIAEHLIQNLNRHPKVAVLYRLRADSAEKLRRRDLVMNELARLASVVKRDLGSVKEYRDGLPETKMGSLPEYFKGIAIKDKAIPKLPLTEAAVAQSENKEWAEDAYQRLLAQTALDTFKEFTNYIHGEWLKTNNMDIAKQATTAYDLAIDALLMPWRGHALDQCLELRYRRAQLHFALKHWDAAAQDFGWLAVHYGPVANRDEALRGEIASLEALLKSSDSKEVRGKLADSYDRFLAFHLNDEKQKKLAATTLSAAARLRREAGENEDALHRMVFYSRHFAESPDAVALTRDILALLEKSSRWEDLRDFSELTLEAKAYDSTAAHKELLHSYEYASLRLLEKLEQDKDWKKAAKEFASFAKKNPKSAFVSQALMKSANAALEMKDNELAQERLEQATTAPEEKTRLQAWLGLEPFYRKGFQWKKLRALYENVISMGSIDAKTKDGVAKNLNSIKDLEATVFNKDVKKLITADPTVAQHMNAQEKYSKQFAEFKALRFKKSNNNPAQNFKKKADWQAKLVAEIDKVVSHADKALKGGAAVWANIAKAELVMEFAETIETSALPAALNAGTEADKKAYVDTILGQAKELRESGRGLVLEASKLITQVDYPIALEERLNKLLENYGETNRFVRADFAQVWDKRPVEKFSQGKLDDEELAKLGLKILKIEKADEVKELQMKIARKYLESGENGYAYATVADLGGEAAKIRFTIDSARLSSKVETADQKWDLARWIAGQPASAESFSKEERVWFEQATQALLRPVSENMKVTAGR